MNLYAYFCYSAKCTGNHKFSHSRAVEKNSLNGQCPDCSSVLVVRKMNKIIRTMANSSIKKEKVMYAKRPSVEKTF